MSSTNAVRETDAAFASRSVQTLEDVFVVIAKSQNQLNTEYISKADLEEASRVRSTRTHRERKTTNLSSYSY